VWKKKPKHRQVIRPQVQLTAWNDVRDGEKTKGRQPIRQCDATDGLHTGLGTAALSRDQDKHDELAEGKMKPRDKSIGDEKPFQIRT
jgi:hypothetical protein